MTSSLRSASLEHTLATARGVAPGLGITRVTDTTWLDSIGIPVYASIRPNADRRTLCVNAGKGSRPAEAEVGAYMEAIEFALAQPEARERGFVTRTPAEIAAQPNFLSDFLDLGPILGRPVDPHTPVVCVEAEEVRTGARADLPAELVFHPFPSPGQAIFGTSTNGLSSGNDVEEATLHGLCELIERDVTSFEYISPTSIAVDDVDVCAPLRDMGRAITDAGFEFAIRYVPNRYHLAYLEAYILESSDEAPIAISVGAGLHSNRDIAAVRALAEAAQSRLSHIHGGRDDLIDRHIFFHGRGRAVELEATRRLRRRVTARGQQVSFADIPTRPRPPTIPDAVTELCDDLTAHGVPQVFRVVLSDPEFPLAVVRVVAPGLEHFKPSFRRVGPRVAAFAEHTEQRRREASA